MTRRLVAAAACLVVTALAAGPAAAQPAPRPLQVDLTLLDAVLEADEPEAEVAAVLRLDAGRQARQDLRLVTTVHAPVTDRRGLAEATAGELGVVFSAVSSALPDLAARTTRLVTTRTPRAALSLSNPDRAGVYPLRFQVFQGSEPVGGVLTSLVVLPESGPAPLPTTTVIRLDQPDAAPVAAEVVDPGLAAVVAPGSAGQALVAEIDRMLVDGTAGGTAVVASGRLMADLTAMADGYRRPDGTLVAPQDRAARRAGAALDAVTRLVRRADVELLSFPHGPADLVALVRGGRQQQAVELVVIGAERTAAILGSQVTSGILVPPDGLDGDTLAAVGELQSEAVLMDARHLAIADAAAMQPVRRLRTDDGGEVRLLVPDEYLSDLLADPFDEGSAAVVQRLLAETALKWAGGEDPRRTGVLMAADPLLADRPLLLAAVTAAVADAPWLRPVDLTALDDLVRPAERAVRLSYPPMAVADELDQDLIARYGQALAALAPLEALLPGGDPTAAQYAESLLVVPSTAHRAVANRSGADARIDRVLAHLAALQGAIRVVASAPITLTAATGEVPVTLVNSGEVPVRVAVQLSSTRFDFPDGGRELVDLPARASAQLRVAATSRNPGGFAAVTVTVTDPAGASTLTQARISVRSTAFPVVGLVAVVGGGLVLLLWGVRQSLRRRQPGRHEHPRRSEEATVA